MTVRRRRSAAAGDASLWALSSPRSGRPYSPAAGQRRAGAGGERRGQSGAAPRRLHQTASIWHSCGATHCLLSVQQGCPTAGDAVQSMSSKRYSTHILRSSQVRSFEQMHSRRQRHPPKLVLGHAVRRIWLRKMHMAAHSVRWRAAPAAGPHVHRPQAQSQPVQHVAARPESLEPAPACLPPPARDRRAGWQYI